MRKALFLLCCISWNCLVGQAFSTGDSILVLSNEGDLTRTGRKVDGLRFLTSDSLIIEERDAILLWDLHDGFADTLLKQAEGHFIDRMMLTHDEGRVIFRESCLGCKGASYLCYSIRDKRLLWRSQVVDFWSDRNGVGISANDSVLFLIGPRRVTLLNVMDGSVIGKKRMFLKFYATPRLGSLECIFSPSGRYVAFRATPFGLYDKHRGQSVYIWSFEEECVEESPFVDGGDVWSLAFSTDERTVYMGNYDGTFRTWRRGSTEIVDAAQLNNELGGRTPWSLSIGKLLMPVSRNNLLAIYGLFRKKWALKVYDYPDLRLRAVLLEPRFADFRDFSAAFSADGRYLVVADKDFLCLYETESWKLKWRRPLEPTD